MTKNVRAWSGPLAVDLVARGRAEEVGGQLLQPALVVGAVDLRRGQPAPEDAEHQDGGGLQPLGEVGGADDRLQGVGQDRRLLPPAGELLALAEQQVLADAEALGHLGQRHGVHDRLADLGERALVEVGVHPVDVIGDDHAEHGVAEELEPLVRGVASVLRAPRSVHERGGQEVGGEVEPETLDQLREPWYREGDRNPYSRPTT